MNQGPEGGMGYPKTNKKQIINAIAPLHDGAGGPFPKEL